MRDTCGVVCCSLDVSIAFWFPVASSWPPFHPPALALVVKRPCFALVSKDGKLGWPGRYRM